MKTSGSTWALEAHSAKSVATYRGAPSSSALTASTIRSFTPRRLYTMELPHEVHDTPSIDRRHPRMAGQVTYFTNSKLCLRTSSHHIARRVLGHTFWMYRRTEPDTDLDAAPLEIIHERTLVLDA